MFVTTELGHTAGGARRIDQSKCIHKTEEALNQLHCFAMAAMLDEWSLVSKQDRKDDDNESFYWFFSKRSNAAINRWLHTNKLHPLAAFSPKQTGVIIITKERFDHAADRREESGVKIDAVKEIFYQLFANGAPIFAQNMSSGGGFGGYEHQLIMVDANFKSLREGVKGQSPAAIIQYDGDPFPHFKLKTAYHAKNRKVEAARKNSLR